MVALLLQGAAAGLIVGFVTASIRLRVDYFFLVIILVGLMHVPVQQAVLINLVVVTLAALMMVFRNTEVLISVQVSWAAVILPAVLGSVVGRILALNLSPQSLLAILGLYAILAGIRLAFIKQPLPERENRAHLGWMAPIAGLSGLLAGLLSTSGKPFTVPLYNAALGHHPR